MLFSTSFEKMLRFLCLISFAALAQTQGIPGVQPLLQTGQTKVVGGEVARPNSFPWQASLQVQRGLSFAHNCGGVLIRRQWLMTAAHCVVGISVSRVVLGDHDLRINENGNEQVFGVSQIIVHPQYNRADLSQGNDIALIRLSSEAVLNAVVQLATLPPVNQILPGNTPCVVTGWGATQTGGQSPPVLMQGRLPIVDFATCSSPSYWGPNLRRTMICAGGGRISGCHGDSGGPLNCPVGGRTVVHGVTSFGPINRCNTIMKPTVFTRVSAFIPWIQSITG